MKNILLILFLAILSSTVQAQSIKGDMNGDGKITMTDANEVVNTALGKSAIQHLANSAPMYNVNNSPIAGTWYKDGSSNCIVLSADGVINDNSRSHVVKFEFLPSVSKLLTYDSEGNPDRYYDVLKLDNNQLVLGRNGDFERYTHEMPSEDDLPQNSVSADVSVSDSKSILAAIYVRFASFMEYELLMEEMAMGKSSMAPLSAITPNNSIISTAFSEGYSTINLCNMLSQRAPEPNIVAHAVAIRSIVYYMMAQLWGDLPYILKYVDAADYTPAITSKETIIEDCIGYLSKNLKNLDVDIQGNRVLDRNSALALLLEMTIFYGKSHGWYSDSELKSNTYDFILYKNQQPLYRVVDNNYVDLLIEERHFNTEITTSDASKESLVKSWMASETRYGVWNALKRLNAATAINGMSNCLRFPYPAREIMYNPAIVQNPGYESTR